MKRPNGIGTYGGDIEVLVPSDSLNNVLDPVSI